MTPHPLIRLVVPLCLVGCVATSQVDTTGREAMAQAQRLDQARRVNQNWAADCTTDHVSGMRRCFAGTFGQPMTDGGEGYGQKSIPFQIYFEGTRGPFIMVGFHTFPGRYPMLRIDHDSALVLNDDGGDSPPHPHPDVVQRLRGATIVRARYDVWPEGGRDMIVDMTGFEQAWTRLRQLVAGAVAPGDSM